MNFQISFPSINLGVGQNKPSWIRQNVVPQPSFVECFSYYYRNVIWLRDFLWYSYSNRTCHAWHLRWTSRWHSISPHSHKMGMLKPPHSVRIPPLCQRDCTNGSNYRSNKFCSFIFYNLVLNCVFIKLKTITQLLTYNFAKGDWLKDWLLKITRFLAFLAAHFFAFQTCKVLAIYLWSMNGEEDS